VPCSQFADAVEHALPALGRTNVLLPPTFMAAPLSQIAHKPQGLIDAFAQEPEVAAEWNLDFASTHTRVLTATCVGLLSESLVLCDLNPWLG
jgi:hypothetical protein